MSWNDGIIEEFRANHGKVGGPFAGVPILLLHHTGARTGTVRVNPLAYMADGDRLVVFGSKGGSPTHPDWYFNLMANPLGTALRTRPATARGAGRPGPAASGGCAGRSRRRWRWRWPELWR